MSALWSPQQREWLQALGYRVLVLAGDESPSLIEVPGQPAEVSVEAAREIERPRSRPQKPANVGTASPGENPLSERASDPAARSPEPALAAAVMQEIATVDRALHRALLRATGQRTTHAAAQVLAQLQPDLATLRGDPAAKRALWSRLRTLRRTSGRR